METRIICVSCGVIADSEADWKTTRAVSLARGWTFAQTREGWRSYCADCPLVVASQSAPVLTKKEKKQARNIKRKTEQAELLKLFKEPDAYAELERDGVWYIKRRIGKKWNVAKYTPESFRKYKEYSERMEASKAAREVGIDWDSVFSKT